MLVPDGFGREITETCTRYMFRRRNMYLVQVLEAACEVTDNLPVVARLEGFRQRRAHARDAALGVGDGAFLLAPAGGGKQDVGEFGGFGVAIRLLQDYQRRAGERLAYFG